MIPVPSTQTFSYAAKRGPFITIVSIFGGLIAVESGIFHLLVLVLIPNVIIKWSIAGILLLFAFFLPMGIMLSALCTKHRLTQHELRIQYGHLLDVTLQRTAIKNALAVNIPLSLFDPLAARYNAQKQRITACFSDQGQILFTLTEPRTIKLGRKEKIVDTLLINVDKREELLAAFQVESRLVLAKQER